MTNKNTLQFFFSGLIILLVTALCVMNFPIITEVEQSIIKFIQAILSNVPLRIPVFLTDLGHGDIRYYIIIAVVVLLYVTKKYKEGLLFLVSLPISELIYSNLKLVVARPRPPIDLRLIDIQHYSFPSGHSTLSMVLYGFLIYLVCKYVKNKIIKTVLVFVLASVILTIGFTRVWLGVHYPTDVIGGFALGICILSIFAFLDKNS